MWEKRWRVFGSGLVMQFGFLKIGRWRERMDGWNADMAICHYVICIYAVHSLFCFAPQKRAIDQRQKYQNKAAGFDKSNH